MVHKGILADEMRNRILLVGSVVLMGILLLLLGGIGGYIFRSETESFTEPTLPGEAIVLLEEYFIDPLPAGIELERGMVKGMIEVLDDPYTKYVDPITHEIRTDNLTGEFAGIGVEIAHDVSGRIYLIPISGGPAKLGGINQGDILIRIDDFVIPEWVDLNLVTSRLRGESGSVVGIEYHPITEPEKTVHVDLTRSVFQLPSVIAYQFPDDPSVGVVKLSMFSEQTVSELEEAYRNLTSRGVSALVLDMRGNGGGLLDSAVDTARFFLEDGVILYEQHREQPLTKYEVEHPGMGSEIPLILIVDGGSASGAEVVAAAITANNRAEIIGEKTYGKGSVQVIVELTDGSSLNITSARWLTPNMESMDAFGIEPDIPISATRSEIDQALLTAVSRLRAYP